MARTSNLLLACAFLFLSCNNHEAEPVADSDRNAEATQTFDMNAARKVIHDQNRRFEDMIKNGDSSGLAALYSSDAMVMAPNSEAVTGDGIAAFWGSVNRMGIREAKVTTTEIIGNGELLSETGNYEMFADNNNSVDKGKYLVVWKQENGQWKIYRDIWTTNLPAAR